MTLKKTENQIESLIIPIHHDWDAKSTWRLIKENLYRDSEGKIHVSKLDRKPDGEPQKWEVLLIKDERAYERLNECQCDFSTGVMCKHWKLII